MATKKFPSELSDRGTVLTTDKLLIHNITTGATCYCTVAELFASPVFTGSIGVRTTSPNKPIHIQTANSGNTPNTVSDFNVEGIGSTGISLTTSASGTAYCFFGDNDDNIGYIKYDHSTDVMTLRANNNLDQLLLQANGDIYCKADVSALSFTDRTPFYDGDAISEIKKITGKDGLINHSSLPKFAQVKRKRNIYKDEIKKVKGKKVIDNIKIGEEIKTERDLGAMISVLTKAVQQLTDRIEKLEK